MSKLHLNYTQEQNGNPYVSFDMDQASVRETVTSFDAVVERVEGKQFSINERPGHFAKTATFAIIATAADEGSASYGHDPSCPP